jgi:nitrilase
MSDSIIKVAVVQMAPIYLNRHKTIEKIIDFIQQAKEKKSQLVVFPELCLSGYPNWINLNNPKLVKEDIIYWQEYINSGISINSTEMQKICTAIKKENIIVVLGIIERDEIHSDVIYNTAVVINSNGELIGVHRKLVPVKNELLFFKKGSINDVKIYGTNVGKIGIGICAEHFNPLYKHSLSELGEQIHCSLWVNHNKLKHVVDATSKAISIENGVFTIVACQVDGLPSSEKKCEIPFIGGSCIISPWGEYIVEPVYNQEIILNGIIDLNDITKVAATFKGSGRDNRNDIFSLSING